MTQTTSPVTFELEAYFSTRTALAGAAQGVKVSARMSAEEASEIAAQLPKSLRIRVNRVVGEEYVVIGFDAQLTANDSNGGANEAGIKRYRSLRKHLDRLGYTVEFKRTRAINSYATEQAFEQAIG